MVEIAAKRRVVVVVTLRRKPRTSWLELEPPSRIRGILGEVNIAEKRLSHAELLRSIDLKEQQIGTHEMCCLHQQNR